MSPSQSGLVYDTSATGLLLPLEGCHNFRAVAGWRSSDGQTVARGALYRADGLNRLSEADHQLLAPARIGHVFDLRASQEIAGAPSRWPAGRSPRTWSGAESAAEANIMEVMKKGGADLAALHHAMCTVYSHLPDELAGAVALVCDALLDPTEASVLVHCTAGKDRTGFVVAMILLAAGVHRDDVFADYLLSNASFEQALVRFNEDGRLDAVEAFAPGGSAALVGVHREYLEASLGRVEETAGSIAAWLDGMAGIDGAKREALAERLLEEAR